MHMAFIDMVSRFTTACTWKNIYQELKKGWNVTAWSIIKKDYQVTGQLFKLVCFYWQGKLK